MMRTLLIRGLLAGLIAGICGFAVAKAIGEPQVDKAIAFQAYVEHHVRHRTPDADTGRPTRPGPAGPDNLVNDRPGGMAGGGEVG